MDLVRMVELAPEMGPHARAEWGRSKAEDGCWREGAMEPADSVPKIDWTFIISYVVAYRLEHWRRACDLGGFSC